MLYSRLFAPWLLWLVYMLTERGSGAVGGAPNGSAAGWSVGAVCSGLAESGWAALRLANCRRPIATALPQAPPRLRHCLQTMHRLIESDSQADRWLRSFNLILHRYDCGQSYSVNFNCQHCQEAYKSWICSSMINYYHHEDGRSVKERSTKQRSIEPIKPCRSFCHRVEQKCPFFLPLDKGPAHYAGEPTFLCLDPNIEETGEQLNKSLYGPSSCCYEECESNPERFCLRGTCSEESEQQEELTSDAFSSRGPHNPSPFIFLFSLSSLLLFRTRLFI